jgi:hypothetical protein
MHHSSTKYHLLIIMRNNNTTLHSHNITPRNLSITLCSIIRYLSTTHHEEINVDTEIEDKAEEYLEEVEVQ